MDFLAQTGYTDSLCRLQSESGLSLSKWQAADNIDLRMITQEFEYYFKMKYGKPPKLVRKSTLEEVEERGGGGAVRTVAPGVPKPPSRSSASTVGGSNMSAAQPGGNTHGGTTPASSSTALTNEPKFGRRSISSASKVDQGTGQTSSSNLVGGGHTSHTNAGGNGNNHLDDLIVSSSLTKPTTGGNLTKQATAQGINKARGTASTGATPTSVSRNDDHPVEDGLGFGGGSDYFDYRLLKPGFISSNTSLNASVASQYNNNGNGGRNDNNGSGGMYSIAGQYRELAEVIQRDIFTASPNVKFSDVVGLATAKQIVLESIVFPLRFPQLFRGLLSPWKGILLYGPPGVGKTLMAKAIATECRTTFFNISASSIVSKYRGDSEKLVRILFEMARYHAPSTIFLDEIDAIMGMSTSARHCIDIYSMAYSPKSFPSTIPSELHDYSRSYSPLIVLHFPSFSIIDMYACRYS